ncbi:MAG: family 20 glycosylhydrolase [Dysgonamonadaceae bacterium]|jgi:hypothetical protein|nr:family 20 glycosylhydrolase [Dysgonamonadaceae bacterium]
MKRIFCFLFGLIAACSAVFAEGTATAVDSLPPVRGLSIGAPSRQGLDDFLRFIDMELAPARFNMLILGVNWNFAYETYPALRGENPLTKADVKRIVAVCKKHNIAIAPHINLLGHQSWATHLGNLLAVYPEFDETPHIKVENYSGWPNPDGLYCKSYCPLHPDLHKVVFALIDELMDVYETPLFHAGMDEVFYIGDDKCPRCGGRDKAELFAGEVTRISNHVTARGGRLMIWGDRLLDGKTTGLGEWEASMNQTSRAIDLIPKEVFICDWHYDNAAPTAVLFATKGFDVAACPWRKPEVAVRELNNMLNFRQNSTQPMASRFQGIIATVWQGTDAFLKEYYAVGPDSKEISDAVTLKRLIAEYEKLK